MFSRLHQKYLGPDAPFDTKVFDYHKFIGEYFI